VLNPAARRICRKANFEWFDEIFGGPPKIAGQRPALPGRKPMFLAKVEGSVVATKKDPSMSGRKMLLLRPQLVDEKDPTKFRPGANTIVAVDCLGAGIGEMVMFTQGSSARLAPGMKDAPVDAVIIGIVDVVDVLGKQIYSGKI
jgi:ethanolamine utilization protein EutN